MGSHDQPWPPPGGPRPRPWQPPPGQPQFPGTGPLPQGYPQGPYPQQPGQYPPPQPGYQPVYWSPQFGGPGPGPKRRKPWPWLIPLIVLVVAAAVVVPIVLTRGSGTSAASGPAAPALKPWMVTAAQTGQYFNGFGAWANGDDLIAAAANAVTAYRRDDGTKAWSVAPPMPGALYCGASRDVSGDRLAVAYGVTSQGDPSDQVCTNLGVINLKTGKFVWSEQYLQGSQNPPAGVAMVIVGNNLFAGFNLADLVSQIDLTTGKTKTHDDMSDGNNASCSINDITATSSTVYYLATCQPGGLDESAGSFDAIRAEDVNTGQQTGFGEINGQNAQMPTDPYGGVEPGAFISASPMVVQTSADTTSGQSTGSFVGLDAALHVTWAVPGTVGDPNSLDILALGDDSAGWTGFGRAFVANGVLLAETTFQNPNGYQNNKIVAIDATTGTEKWRTGMTNVAFVGPFAVNGSSVLAVGQTTTADSTGNTGTVLAHFDLDSGKLTSSRILPLPVKGTNISLANDADLESVWWVAADGRIYGATTQNGPNTAGTMPEVFAVG